MQNGLGTTKREKSGVKQAGKKNVRFVSCCTADGWYHYSFEKERKKQGRRETRRHGGRAAVMGPAAEAAKPGKPNVSAGEQVKGTRRLTLLASELLWRARIVFLVDGSLIKWFPPLFSRFVLNANFLSLTTFFSHFPFPSLPPSPLFFSLLVWYFPFFPYSCYSGSFHFLLFPFCATYLASIRAKKKKKPYPSLPFRVFCLLAY